MKKRNDYIKIDYPISWAWESIPGKYNMMVKKDIGCCYKS